MAAPATLPASIEAYRGKRDALRLYEVAPIVGIRRKFTHAKLHELGIAHYHANCQHPHPEGEIDKVKGGIVPVSGLAAWLEGRRSA